MPNIKINYNNIQNGIERGNNNTNVNNRLNTFNSYDYNQTITKGDKTFSQQAFLLPYEVLPQIFGSGRPLFLLRNEVDQLHLDHLCKDLLTFHK